MRKIVPFLCIVFVIVLAGCKEKVKPGSAEVKRQIVTGVTVGKIPLSQIDSFYETSGTVKAKTTSIISSRIMGAVTSVNVKEGDRVRAGDLLITIDDRDIVQRMMAAEAVNKEALNALESARHQRFLAKVTYDRYKNLYAEKAISGQEMDQVETQKKVAESEYERFNEMVKRTRAAIEEIRVNHGFTRIMAPISGIVTEKKIEQGNMVTPGVPLLLIDQTSQFKVEAYIDESISGRFKIGMPAYVVLDGKGGRIRGTIGEIVPVVDPASRTYLIRIYVEDLFLKTGLYCKVLIPEGRRGSLLVPKKTVVERGQLTGVYAVDEKGIMTYRLIKTGKVYGDKVEVLSGLKAGDSLVLDGVEKALDGGMIKQ